MAQRKHLTLADIIDVLEEEDDILEGTLYTCPPSNHMLSDEDSDEDNAVVGDINRLSGNQLRAEAVLECTRRLGDTLVTEVMGQAEESNDSEDDLPLSQLGCSTSQVAGRHQPRNGRSTVPERDWTNTDLGEYQRKDWDRPEFLNMDRSPVLWFEMFYDDDVIDLFVRHSKLYAVLQGNSQFDVTNEEMRLVFAICLLSGYCVYARNRMYWDTGADTYHPGIANAISRSRFEEILRYIHVCNNALLDPQDKFTKVRPLWKILNEKWMAYSPKYTEVSIDESMIPYYGHHSTKQHIHGKPIRFGFKTWCMATRLGYLIQAEPYQGASTGNTNPELGVGGSVVTSLVAKLGDGFQAHVYMDNFFTSLRLLKALKESGHQDTGTIRANRVEKAPLKLPQDMKKQPRGGYHQITDTSTGITLVRYHDNNIVTVASTCEGVAPMGSAQRWSASEKRRVVIQQPSCVQQYNKFMGGVDRLDQNIGCYRISINRKKWYWQLLMWPLNASMNNAFQLYRLSQAGQEKGHLDFLGFIREVTTTYLGRYLSVRAIGRPIKAIKRRRVPDGVRLDGKGHLITSNPTQIRCAECHKNTTKKCSKCDVGCHTNCFFAFHS